MLRGKNRDNRDFFAKARTEMNSFRNFHIPQTFSLFNKLRKINDTYRLQKLPDLRPVHDEID